MHWTNNLGLIEGFCTVCERPRVDLNPWSFALKVTTLTTVPQRPCTELILMSNLVILQCSIDTDIVSVVSTSISHQLRVRVNFEFVSTSSSCQLRVRVNFGFVSTSGSCQLQVCVNFEFMATIVGRVFTSMLESDKSVGVTSQVKSGRLSLAELR